MARVKRKYMEQAYVRRISVYLLPPLPLIKIILKLFALNMISFVAY